MVVDTVGAAGTRAVQDAVVDDKTLESIVKSTDWVKRL